MCTRYPIINRVSELKVHIELTRFVQPEKIEIDANERAVNEKSQYCFFVCTTFDSFLNDLMSLLYHNDTIIKKEKELLRALLIQFCKLEFISSIQTSCTLSIQYLRNTFLCISKIKFHNLPPIIFYRCTN